MPFLRELIGQVAGNLLRNKLRSSLTMAGIAWGVASMVLIVAMGDGFQLGQRNNMKELGENMVIVFNGRTERQAGGQRAGRRIRLTYDDVRDIRKECWTVRYSIGELSNNVKAVTAFNSGAFNTIGAESLYPLIRSTPIAEGRFLNEAEDREARRVCILGYNVRRQLFGDRQNLLGSQILLNGLPFRLIGLMPKKNQNSAYNGLDDDKVFVPYSTMMRDFPLTFDWFETGMLSDLIYVPRSLADFKTARRQVMHVLGRNHRFDPADLGAVFIWDTVEQAQLIDNIFVSMTAFLGSIAFVTLTLGGVGVLNIMLVSVSERTREIGLRKAVGATRARILADFMLEGILLAVASGTFGFLSAFGLAAIVNTFPLPEMFPALPVNLGTALWAFSALALIAVSSAAWPAWRAASLTPVEALRYER